MTDDERRVTESLVRMGERKKTEWKLEEDRER